jgi:hypothetical protein
VTDKPPRDEADAARLVREAAERRAREREDVNARLDAVEATSGRAETIAREVLDRLKKKDKDAEQDPAPRPFHWADLEHDHAQLRWKKLRRWLDEVFTPTYPGDAQELRGCWWRHPDVFAVVTDTWQAWEHANRHDKGAVLDGLRWQHEWRPKMTAYAHDVLGRCGTGHHDPETEGLADEVTGAMPARFPF